MHVYAKGESTLRAMDKGGGPPQSEQPATREGDKAGKIATAGGADTRAAPVVGLHLSGCCDDECPFPFSQAPRSYATSDQGGPLTVAELSPWSLDQLNNARPMLKVAAAAKCSRIGQFLYFAEH